MDPFWTFVFFCTRARARELLYKLEGFRNIRDHPSLRMVVMGCYLGVPTIRLGIVTQTTSHTYHQYETHGFDSHAHARELLYKIEGFPEPRVYLLLRVVVLGCYLGVLTIRRSIMTQTTPHTYHKHEIYGFLHPCARA